MPSRRELIEKAKRPVESVAGTIASAYSSAKDKAAVQKLAAKASDVREQRADAKKEQRRGLQQERARLERARQNAYERAQKKARTEFVDEFEDELVKELKAQELRRLNQQYGHQMPASSDRDAEPAPQAPPPAYDAFGFSAGGDFVNAAFGNPFAPPPPPPPDDRERDDRGGGQGSPMGDDMLAGLFGAGAMGVAPMGFGGAEQPDDSDDQQAAPVYDPFGIDWRW